MKARAYWFVTFLNDPDGVPEGCHVEAAQLELDGLPVSVEDLQIRPWTQLAEETVRIVAGQIRCDSGEIHGSLTECFNDWQEALIAEYGRRGVSFKALGEMFWVNPQNVSQIVKRRAVGRRRVDGGKSARLPSWTAGLPRGAARPLVKAGFRSKQAVREAVVAGQGLRHLPRLGPVRIRQILHWLEADGPLPISQQHRHTLLTQIQPSPGTKQPDWTEGLSHLAAHGLVMAGFSSKAEVRGAVEGIQDLRVYPYFGPDRIREILDWLETGEPLSISPEWRHTLLSKSGIPPMERPDWAEGLSQSAVRSLLVGGYESKAAVLEAVAQGVDLTRLPGVGRRKAEEILAWARARS